MNRLLPILFGVLLAAALLAGCAGPAAPEAPEPSAPPAVEESSAPGPSEPAESEPEPPSETPDIPAEMEAVKAAILPVAAEVESPNGYPEPTGEQYRRMSAAVAALGPPVTAPGLDMRNYEQAVAFCGDAAAGKDGELTVYQIRNSYLFADTFRSEGGDMTLRSSYWPYGEDPDAPVTTDPAQPLSRFELQPGGHLLYEVGEYGEPNGFRVLPIGEENRALAEKYVRPVCHTRYGVTSSDWDENNLSGIAWEWTFEGLLMSGTGETIMDAYPEPYGEGAESPYAVPGAEVDRMLTACFPVSAARLHSLSAYDAAREVYAWQGFWGGTDFREPEVVSRTDNPDGSFTLTVNFIGNGFDESGESCELTIRDHGDGTWMYLGNRHHPAPEA